MPDTQKLAQGSFDEPGSPAASTFAQRLDVACGFLRRQYWIVLLGFLVALPIGAIYHYSSPASYTASATLLIETRRNALQETFLGSAPQDAAWIESQLGVLKSLNVAAYVVKQLRLADEPDFVRAELGLLDRMLIRLRLKAAPNLSEADRTARAVAAVSRGLDVRRIGLSYMMRVDFRSHNPEIATRVANAMIDAYVYEQLNAKYQANRRAGDWLQERLSALREQAAAAERAVIEFRSKNNIVSAGGTLMNDNQLAEVNGQLAKARARAEDLTARLERIAAVREAYGEDQPLLFDETTTEAMGNAIITGLRTRYLELVNREVDFSAKYGKNHAAVVNTRNQIRAIRTSIRDELGRIEATFRSELQIAQRREDELKKSLGTVISQSTVTNQAQVALFSLESAAQSYRKLYDSFLQRHTEVVQQQSFPIVEARSLSPASVSKTGPKALQIWLATIFGGAALGIGGGLLREAMDRGFRTREQVRSVLQTDCLALVPRLPPQARRLTPQRSEPMPMVGTRAMDDAEFAAHMAHRAAHSNSSDLNVMRTVVDTPTSSPYAEAIRSIKLSVDLNTAGSYTKVIGFTSCLPSEGKTTLASAMATIISQSGARILLVDCDLRNPSLSRMLTPNATVGLLDVVAGKVSLADAIWTDSSSTLSFLPSVVDDRHPYATEMLSSEATKSLFDSLQIRYDYVILDLAPMVAALDVRAAAHVVDSYVMVVEWGITKVDAVKYALRTVAGVQEKLAGVVLNKVDMNSMKYYDNYGAVYYYGQSRHPVR